MRDAIQKWLASLFFCIFGLYLDSMHVYTQMISVGKYYKIRLFIVEFLWLLSYQCYTQTDTLKNLHPQRYIRPCLYFNHLNSPESKRMKPSNSYSFKQNNLGFFVPIHSTSWFNEYQKTISSIHFLVGADMVSYRPDFSFINENFKINRFSANLKFFYVSGIKGIFYVGVSPFSSRVIKVKGVAFTSMNASFIYNRTVNSNFSYRLGITNTYSFGRSLPLPILGIRVGQLNKTHLSIQFPRNLTLDIPISKKTNLSIFGKSIGGVYAIKFSDTLLTKKDTKAILGRYEILHGLQMDFNLHPNFSMYLGLGFVSRRQLNFNYKENNAVIRDKNKIPPAGLLSFGFSIRFGKVSQRYYDPQMNNLFELNTSTGAGTNDRGTQNADLPTNPDIYDINKMDKIKYKDVEDIITDEY